VEESLSNNRLPEIALGHENRAISQSVRIKPGHYQLQDTDGRGAVRVEADNVTIDFQGATLASCDVAGAKRETFEGIGINIEGRKNVTIKNAVVHGYQFNIRVLNCQNVRLEGCDVSYSRADKVWDHGAPVNIWLEIRDIGYWRTYGAGIWMEKTRESVVQQCKGLYAQDGIVMAFCDHSLVTENDFSFNSGWGIALWESCDNIISWNLTDFVDRPYVGALGADSSCVAVANGSHRNYFVGNSMTHGGDGFFLTNLTDTGYDPETDRFDIKGSSDDNVMAYNDGSWSPANAFEGTFSWRNVYYRNFANDSGYGFWLGFSNDSLILDNEILRNVHSGIAIEQGSGTRVEKNRIEENGRFGVHLWATPKKPCEDYPSRNLEIRGNEIRRSPGAVDLTNSTDYYVGENTLEDAPLPEGLANTKSPDAVTALDRFLGSAQHKKLQEILSTQPAGFRLYRDTDGPRGYEWTQMDDYAPRDFRGQLAAWRKDGWKAVELFIFDPGGTVVKTPEWAKVTRGAADPRIVRIELGPEAPMGQAHELEVTLTSEGRQRVIREILIEAEWTLKYFRWDEALAYDDDTGWDAVFSGKPVLERQAREKPGWHMQFGLPGLPELERFFAVSASTRIRLPAGTYKFAADFAGGLKILVDGREIARDWGAKRYSLVEGTIGLPAGEHDLEFRLCSGTGRTMLHLYWGRIK
jgi:parallel beta-helix repeat protein